MPKFIENFILILIFSFSFPSWVQADEEKVGDVCGAIIINVGKQNFAGDLRPVKQIDGSVIVKVFFDESVYLERPWLAGTKTLQQGSLPAVVNAACGILPEQK